MKTIKQNSCRNCENSLISNNGNAKYCYDCSYLIRKYNNVIKFMDLDYKKLSEDRKKNILWLMFKKDFGF